MIATETVSEFEIKYRYKTNRSSPVKWIISHAINQWYFVLLAITGAVGNAALASVPAIYFGRVYSEITQSIPNKDLILRLALIVLFSQVLRGFLQFARNYGFELVAQRIERNVREELYISLLGKSMTFHALQSIGDLMARATNDVREVNFLFSPGLNMVFGSLNFLFLPLIVGPQYHPALVITPALFIVAYFISIRHYLKTLSPITTKVRRTFGIMNSRLSEAIDGIETVKSAAQEKNEIDRYEANSIAYRDASIKQGLIEARFIPLLLLAIAMGFGLLHAMLLFNMGLIPLGSVISYFSTLSLLGFPTFTSIFSYSQISLGIASAKRLLETMNTENNLDENKEGYYEKIQGNISFNNVSFSYNGSEPIIKSVSFTASPGQTIAVVGQTGSGKTTLAYLVNRTYDVSSGEILLDSINLKNWNLDALRSQISIIEQDIFLFSRSVAENIAFGMPAATQAQIETAAKAAQAHEFIVSLEDGYQTIIGERGVTLSGGQRQRLALARAFLTDPRILILDDSTSAIDSETEDKIQKAIFNAAKGRTTFIITHRLSQIRWADLIIVLHQGRVVAAGKHEELLKSSVPYRQIFSE